MSKQTLQKSQTTQGQVKTRQRTIKYTIIKIIVWKRFGG